MKLRIYLRIGKTGRGYKVAASTKDSKDALYVQSYYGRKEFLPTVAYAVDFVLPDSTFATAAKVIGEINVSEEKTKIAASVPSITELEVKEDET